MGACLFGTDPDKNFPSENEMQKITIPTKIVTHITICQNKQNIIFFLTHRSALVCNISLLTLNGQHKCI